MRISDWSSDVCSSDLGAKPPSIRPGTTVDDSARHSTTEIFFVSGRLRSSLAAPALFEPLDFAFHDFADEGRATLAPDQRIHALAPAEWLANLRRLPSERRSFHAGVVSEHHSLSISTIILVTAS